MNYCINLSQVHGTDKHILVKYISPYKTNVGYVRELWAVLKECNWVARDYDPFRINLPPMPQPVVEHGLAKEASASCYQDPLQFNSSIVSDLSANNLTADVRDVTVAAISSV